MKDEATLSAALAAIAERAPPAGSWWTHVRAGGLYRVTGAAVHEETLEPLVTYWSAACGVTWARPLALFTDGRFVPAAAPPAAWLAAALRAYGWACAALAAAAAAAAALAGGK